MRQNYLSDEELLDLIKDVEENSYIEAPKHLKSNVLSKIAADKKRTRTINIATYRLKMCVAMAASILLFCVLPYKMPSQYDRAVMQAEYRKEKFLEYSKKREEETKKKEEREENIQRLTEERDEFVEKITDSINLKKVIERIR